MSSCLNLARGYAIKAGLDIIDRKKEIEEIGYKKAVPVELANARKYAKKGMPQ